MGHVPLNPIVNLKLRMLTKLTPEHKRGTTLRLKMPPFFIRSLKMRRKFALLLAVLAINLITPALAARCTGSDPCHACKNCHYCKRCAQEGGTCGVCRPRRTRRQACTRQSQPQFVKQPITYSLDWKPASMPPLHTGNKDVTEEVLQAVKNRLRTITTASKRNVSSQPVKIYGEFIVGAVRAPRPVPPSPALPKSSTGN